MMTKPNTDKADPPVAPRRGGPEASMQAAAAFVHSQLVAAAAEYISPSPIEAPAAEPLVPPGHDLLQDGFQRFAHLCQVIFEADGPLLTRSTMRNDAEQDGTQDLHATTLLISCPRPRAPSAVSNAQPKKRSDRLRAKPIPAAAVTGGGGRTWARF